MTRPLEQSHTTAVTGTVFDTCEVRWFAEGSLPRALVSWFTAGGQFGVAEQRTDLYQMRGGTMMGVKRRSGLDLEVKVLQKTGAGLTLPGGLTGAWEAWRKSHPGNGTTFTSGAMPWVAVAKSIVTRSFVLPGNGRVASVEDPDRRLPGCDVELADVSVGGTQAWTYAFEAFGPAEHRLAALRIAAEAVARSTPYPPAFVEGLECNASYPAWLSTLRSVGAEAAAI